MLHSIPFTLVVFLGLFRCLSHCLKIFFDFVEALTKSRSGESELSSALSAPPSAVCLSNPLIMLIA